ncbi:hypothetical protein EI94DRAFT_131920 [Lactarius quietus]|nr:hypothetical protein EI94DRAFT_131920 [Lactarius quietus]
MVTFPGESHREGPFPLKGGVLQDIGVHQPLSLLLLATTPSSTSSYYIRCLNCHLPTFRRGRARGHSYTFQAQVCLLLAGGDLQTMVQHLLRGHRCWGISPAQGMPMDDIAFVPLPTRMSDFFQVDFDPKQHGEFRDFQGPDSSNTKMRGVRTLNEYWPGVPIKGHFHVCVRFPSGEAHMHSAHDATCLMFLCYQDMHGSGLRKMMTMR